MNWCVSGSNIKGVTNHFLAGQIIGPEKYPNTIIILVNGHNIKLTLNGFSLYTWINLSLTPHWRSFHLQLTVIKTDTQLVTMQ